MRWRACARNASGCRERVGRRAVCDTASAAPLARARQSHASPRRASVSRAAHVPFFVCYVATRAPYRSSVAVLRKVHQRAQVDARRQVGCSAREHARCGFPIAAAGRKPERHAGAARQIVRARNEVLRGLDGSRAIRQVQRVEESVAKLGGSVVVQVGQGDSPGRARRCAQPDRRRVGATLILTGAT